LHHPHGLALLRATDTPVGELVDLLVEASNKPSEVPNMHDTLRQVGEAGFSKMIEKHASANRLPGETPAQAFTRIFTEDSDQGAAIRKCWQIAKQLDPDEARAEGRRVVDDAVDDELDALARVERLAVEERRRDPKLTKAQAFTKAYTDPANAALAQRERRANRPRA
jgi:hypothetical protein